MLCATYNLHSHSVCAWEGSVYVFLASYGGLLWTEAQKLVASDGATLERFGASISVSGSLLAVGAVNDNDQGTNSGCLKRL